MMSLSKNSREKPSIGHGLSTNNNIILVKLSGKSTELDKERRQMIRKEVTSTWCRICLTIDKINDVVHSFLEIKLEFEPKPFTKCHIKFNNVKIVTQSVEAWIYHGVTMAKTRQKCKDYITNSKWQGHLQFILLNILGNFREYLIQICKIDGQYIGVIIRELLIELNKKQSIVRQSPPVAVFPLQRIFVWSPRHFHLEKSKVGKVLGMKPHFHWSDMRALYDFVLSDFNEEFLTPLLQEFIEKHTTKKTRNPAKLQSLETAYESGYEWVKWIILKLWYYKTLDNLCEEILKNKKSDEQVEMQTKTKEQKEQKEQKEEPMLPMIADTIPNVFDYDAPAISEARPQMHSVEPQAQQLLGGGHGMIGMTGIQMDVPRFGNVPQNLHPMTQGQGVGVGVEQNGTHVPPMNMYGNGNANGFGYGMGFTQTPMHQVQVPQFPQFPQAPQFPHMHQLPQIPQVPHLAHLAPRQMIPTGMGFNSNNNIGNMSNHFHNPNVNAPCCNCGHFAVSPVSAISAPSASIAPMSENYGYYGPTRGSSNYSIQSQNNDFQFFDNVSCSMNSVFSPSVSQIGGIGSIGSIGSSSINHNVNMNMHDMNLNSISGFDNSTVVSEAMNMNNGNISIGTFSMNSMNNINDQFTSAATVVSDVSHSSNGSTNNNGSINTSENENMNENHNGNTSIVDDATGTVTGTANMGIELDEISPPIVNEDASSVVAVAEEDKMSQFNKELELNKSMDGFDDDDIFNGEAASGFMDDMSMMGGIMGGFNFGDMESINSGF